MSFSPRRGTGRWSRCRGRSGEASARILSAISGASKELPARISCGIFTGSGDTSRRRRSCGSRRFFLPGKMIRTLCGRRRGFCARRSRSPGARFRKWKESIRIWWYPRRGRADCFFEVWTTLFSSRLCFLAFRRVSVGAGGRFQEISRKPADCWAPFLPGQPS